MMSDEVLFSLIKRNNKGKVLLRETETREEFWFEKDEFESTFMSKDGSKYLFVFNPNSPAVKKMEAMNSYTAKHIIPAYLLARAYMRGKSDNHVNMLLFGGSVREFCDKYELSMADFIPYFRKFHYRLFGEYPSMTNVLTLGVPPKEEE